MHFRHGLPAFRTQALLGHDIFRRRRRSAKCRQFWGMTFSAGVGAQPHELPGNSQ